MLLRTTLLAATAAIGIAGPSVAGDPNGPVILDDQRLDLIVAGSSMVVQIGDDPARIRFLEADLSSAIDEINGCDFHCSIQQAVLAEESGYVTVTLQK